MQRVIFNEPAFDPSELNRFIEEGQTHLDQACLAGVGAIAEAKRSPEFGSAVSEVTALAAQVFGPRQTAVWFIQPDLLTGISPAQALMDVRERPGFVTTFKERAERTLIIRLASSLGM